MEALGQDPSSWGAARFYTGLIDEMVIHPDDCAEQEKIEALGVRVFVTQTLMPRPADSVRLARVMMKRFAEGEER